MRFFTTALLTLVLMLSSLNADELSDAYIKEYTFLKAQKNELKSRLKKEQKQQNREISKGKKKVSALQDKYVKLSKDLKTEELSIEKATQLLSDKTSNKDIINSVIIQAKMALGDYGIKVDDSSPAQVDTMERAFKDSANLYDRLSSIQVIDGQFYKLDGTTAKGKLVQIGNIATYGVSNNVQGALAPAGGGQYKIWNKPGSSDDAKSFHDKILPKTIDIFVYENLQKEVDYQKEKTIEDTLEGGGTIGYIILALGAFGILLLLLRVIFLAQAGSNVKKITSIVYEKLENGTGEDAYKAIEHYKGSTARVIRATLRNIDKDRDHIEDIVMENILNENTALDRFGNFILVLAAVAPLLGLLGTVTGMIATFDIITTHGTGDPKLLSGGISEALVTTMLGLVVAIPLLLLGNLLGGWAQSIKDSMEQSALHVVNLFEKHNAK
ncbi:MAG: MotA/TolQ/ExbB proton channel family protein [Campylobacterota bacterium]|nr:MotA/TolQ/ExbB proton channel family protein [Campylobacterota bacterium]